MTNTSRSGHDLTKERYSGTILNSSAKNPSGGYCAEESLNVEGLGASPEVFLIINHSICSCTKVL
jgi:hypothetical protein